MTTEQIAAALAGVAIGVGVVLMIAGWVQTPQRVRRRGRRTSAVTWAHSHWRWGAAALAGFAVWTLTSWPVAGLTAAIAVVGLPSLLSTARTAARGIERIEAVEEWARRLGDILSVGVGLEQAVTTSVRTVPDPIRSEVTTLAARLSARMPTEQALRLFADDLNDATGDLVVAALLLGHRRRGPGVARTLSSVADSVADEVATRRRIEADRAKPRTTARAVTLITVGVAGLGMLNREYVEPYGTPLGQLALLAIVGMFVGSLVWMRSLTLGKPQPRLIAATTASEGSR
jgi:Flp pilus assembly protein TadB